MEERINRNSCLILIEFVNFESKGEKYFEKYIYIFIK